MDLTLIVLAAGMGSRYGGLKQLDPVGPSGEFILDYSVFDAIRCGFNKVIFIIRKDIEDIFKEKVGKRYEGHIKVAYAYQELDKLPEGFHVPAGRTKPWGTGHALLMTSDLCNEPFCVLNADDFYGADSFQIVANHFKNSNNASEMVIPAFRVENTLSDFGSVSRGVCSEKNGYLTSIVERTQIEKSGQKIVFIDEEKNTHELASGALVSMNMWGLLPSFYDVLSTEFKGFLAERGQELKSEYYLPYSIDLAINKLGLKVKVYESTEQWFGVTYPEDKEAVVANIRKKVTEGLYPERLWKN